VAAQPEPVVFRPRALSGTGIIWAVSAAGLALLAVIFVATNLGVQFKPSPGMAGGFAVVVVIALLNRVGPLGLDRLGLHIGSADEGYVVPWSNITGVVILPRTLLSPERIRIRLADRRLAPGRWARLRWGVRVHTTAEIDLPLSHGQSTAKIADQIRHFIDAYG
jgi:hypothetical protein